MLSHLPAAVEYKSELRFIAPHLLPLQTQCLDQAFKAESYISCPHLCYFLKADILVGTCDPVCCPGFHVFFSSK